jgi:mRNA interferase MazF
MKRGDIVTIALQGDLGKPRPALIVQSDFFEHHPSVVVLPITSEIRETPLFRFTIEPTKKNGFSKTSQVMIDKVQSVAREKLRTRFGKVLDSELLEIERLLALFLGLSE